MCIHRNMSSSKRSNSYVLKQLSIISMSHLTLNTFLSHPCIVHPDIWISNVAVAQPWQYHNEQNNLNMSFEIVFIFRSCLVNRTRAGAKSGRYPCEVWWQQNIWQLWVEIKALWCLLLIGSYLIRGEAEINFFLMSEIMRIIVGKVMVIAAIFWQKLCKWLMCVLLIG